MRKNKVVKKVLRFLLYFIFLSGTTALAAPYAPPVAFFFGTPQEGTAPLTVVFTDASDGDVSTWMWDFGDGTTSRQKDPRHQYNEPGCYSVALTISGPEGSDTITRLGYMFVSEPDPHGGDDILSLAFANMYENPLILANKEGSAHNREEDLEERKEIIQNTTTTTPTPTTLPEAKQETISTQPDPALYISHENDVERRITETEEQEETKERKEEISQNTTATITQPDPALYISHENEAERRKNETEEQEETEEGEEEISQNTTATITPNPTDLPEATQETNITQLDPALYTSHKNDAERRKTETEEQKETEEGEEEISQNTTAIITHLDPTPYASLGNDAERDEKEPVLIFTTVPLVPPRAMFTVDPIEGMVPLTITCTDTSAGNVKERIWSFGDKTKSEEPKVEHTYTKPGKYPISLTVTGYDGTMDRRAGFITVFPLPDPPVPKIACNTMEVFEITCETMVSPEIGNVSWLWEFGDGYTSAEQDPVHTYEALGTYMVSVTAIDAYEQTGFDSIEINLELPSLDATFTYEIDEQDPMTVTYTGNEGSDTWNWEFGDGESGTGQNIKHSYNMPGEMNITLTVADAYQEKQLSQKILISAPPIDVNFAITLSDAQEPYTISFFDRSYGPITAWQWDFGDGQVSKEQNPAHAYNEAGEYTVQLIITSRYGETKMQQVRLIIPEQGN